MPWVLAKVFRPYNTIQYAYRHRVAVGVAKPRDAYWCTNDHNTFPESTVGSGSVTEQTAEFNDVSDC